MSTFLPKSPGSVLVLTLMIMSVVTIFTQQLVKSTFVGTYFVRAMIDREHAEMLALGGLNLAISQLIPPEVSSKQQAMEKGDKGLMQTKKFLQRMLPHLNKWQEFELDEDLDGVQGKVRFCISSEHGKINLNDAFDFKKGEFKKEMSALLKGLTTRTSKTPGNVLKKLTQFLKKRKRKLDDITELLSVDTLSTSNVFYRPPQMPKGKKTPQANSTVFLQDLFTVSTQTEKMQPLLFSDSMLAVLNLRRPIADDAQRIKDKYKQVIEQFKPDWGKDWESNWKFLQILYDQKPAILKAIKGLFSQQFEPKIYSVLSCGMVGEVEQYLLAIICKSEEEPDKKKKEKEEEKIKGEQHTKPYSKPFIIKKIYWI